MKLKQTAILLLAAALILLGGFLPRLAGGVQDRVSIGKVEYPMLSQIVLDMGDQSGKQLSTTAKLSILKNFSGSLELPDSMAQTSRKELLAIASNWATRYYDAGLLPMSPSFDSTDMGAQAYLVYWDNERAYSNIYWRLEIVCCGGKLELIVDDETGTLCTILFTDNREPTAEGYLYDVESAMSWLCRLYLEGLGEEFEKYNPDTIAANSRIASAYEGDEVLSSLITELIWGDILFGQTTVFFAADPHGFYTVII